MTKNLIGWSLVTLVAGTVSLAQAPPAPKPGPEHKAFAYFEGKWTSTGEMKPGPLGPGGKVTGSDTCEWFPGGFHLVCRGEGTGPMGSMKTLGVMSYNAEDKKYAYYGVDSLGTSELSNGTKSGGTWTYTATSNMGGKTFQSRYTIVETPPNGYTFKWESSPDGTKWAVLMEGKATRGPKGS
jgi:hypothetical protein